MRSAILPTVLPWAVGVVLLVPLCWLGVRLWGISDLIFMHVSASAGPEAPAEIVRTEYGQLDYLSSGTSMYVDRTETSHGTALKPSRTETRRAIHWVALSETVAVSVGALAACAALVLWAARGGHRKGQHIESAGDEAR